MEGITQGAGATQRPAAVARGAPAAPLYVAGLTTLASVVVLGGLRPADRVVLQLGAAVLSVVAVLGVSARARAVPSPAWAVHHHDPSLAFAGAMIVAVLPAVLELGAARSGAADSWVLEHSWVTAAVAASLAAVGFLILIQNMALNRVLDALYLSGIVATASCLAIWATWASLHDAGKVQASPELATIAPVALDLLAVSLGVVALRMRAAGRWSWALLVVGWTAVVGIRIVDLLVAMTGHAVEEPAVAASWIMAFALLGASALHPHAARPAEPVHGLRDRLPWIQVAFFAASVCAGPVLLVGLGTPAPHLDAGLLLASGLSLLVVVYLVRLVQGRAMLEHRAHHDELTGLANRRHFEDRLALALAHARRTDGHSAVLFLDLDRFKNVNDSLGHAVGNLLLQAVAARLSSAARPVDTIARLGGDEFVVVVPDLRHPQDAERVADQLLRRFTDPFSINGHRVFVSPSIGVAVYPADGTEVAELIENADRAMYQAKQRGRRRTCTYEQSMGDHAQDRLDLESRLHTAVERGELRLHYQPKLHLPSGRFTGMEALLRWQHPELGLLEPARFVPLAEESGLIVPIGEWALEEACRQNQEWVDKGLPPLVVAVNMSLQQFQQQAVEDVTARILRSTGLDPRLLELELTESLAMHDQRSVHSALADIRRMGVACSIDDFGTGYSGLSHLTQMPIDKLKIDKSFVATIDAEREAPIVVAVVALAHGLGLQVVAEGVETSAQLERLLELGCDEMQGYLFSQPMDASTFEDLLVRESMAASRQRPGAGGPIGPLDTELAGTLT